MRSKMIHEYFDVDWDLVWATVNTDLPRLQQQIDRFRVQRRPGPGQQSDEDNDRPP